MLPVLTIYLTPKDFGLTGLLAAYIGSLGALKELGLTFVFSTSFFKFKTRFKFIWKRLYGFLSIWSIFLSGISALIIWNILPESENAIRPYVVFLYCIPIAFFDVTISLGNRFFQISQRPVQSISISIISGLLGVLINYYTIKVLRLGYFGGIISLCSVSFVSFLSYILYFNIKEKIYPVYNFNLRWLWKYLVIAIPFIPHYYTKYVLDSSDRIILNFYNVSIEEIGLYSLAYNFGAYFSILGMAIGTAVGPFHFELFAKKNMESEFKARNITFVTQGAMLFLGFLICLWFKEGIDFLIKNEDLKKAYGISIVVLLSYSYLPTYFAVANKLQFVGKTAVFWKITVMAIILNIILNMIFIPIWGIWAATFSTLIAMIYSGFIGFLFKEFKQNNVVNYYPLYWLTLILSTVVISYFIKDIDSKLKLIITLISCSIVFLGIKKYKYKFVN